ncbi:hypothetical protein FOZ61_007337 [Perkinsus olseni]|uniref:CCHC-type domain-containing protein n=1 Tax=Perkinsus olseni TaxID=32597 RepID=A0A7J6L9I5_PEROL|nr:hypothetical protein FOZ61_007337 [Perkinsus olseni]
MSGSPSPPPDRTTQDDLPSSSSSSALLESLSYDDDAAHEALVRGLFPSAPSPSEAQHTEEQESAPSSSNETTGSRAPTGRTPTEDPTPYEGTRSTLTTTTTTESHVSVSSGEVAEHTGELPYLTAYLKKHPDASHFTKQHTASHHHHRGGGGGGGRYWEKPAEKTVCWVCLGSHDSSVCSRKRCFRCAQEGHGSAECSSSKWCTICRKQGHNTPEACPTTAYRTSLNPRFHASLTCMVCGRKGHLLCGPHSQVLHMAARTPDRYTEMSVNMRVHDTREYGMRSDDSRMRRRSRSRSRESPFRHRQPDYHYREARRSPLSSSRSWRRGADGDRPNIRSGYEMYPSRTPPPSQSHYRYQQPYSPSPVAGVDSRYNRHYEQQQPGRDGKMPMRGPLAAQSFNPPHYEHAPPIGDDRGYSVRGYNYNQASLGYTANGGSNGRDSSRYRYPSSSGSPASYDMRHDTYRGGAGAEAGTRYRYDMRTSGVKYETRVGTPPPSSSYRRPYENYENAARRDRGDGNTTSERLETTDKLLQTCRKGYFRELAHLRAMLNLARMDITRLESGGSREGQVQAAQMSTEVYFFDISETLEPELKEVLKESVRLMIREVLKDNFMLKERLAALGEMTDDDEVTDPLDKAGNMIRMIIDNELASLDQIFDILLHLASDGGGSEEKGKGSSREEYGRFRDHVIGASARGDADNALVSKLAAMEADLIAAKEENARLRAIIHKLREDVSMIEHDKAAAAAAAALEQSKPSNNPVEGTEGDREVQEKFRKIEAQLEDSKEECARLQKKVAEMEAVSAARRKGEEGILAQPAAAALEAEAEQEKEVDRIRRELADERRLRTAAEARCEGIEAELRQRISQLVEEIEHIKQQKRGGEGGAIARPEAVDVCPTVNGGRQQGVHAVDVGVITDGSHDKDVNALCTKLREENSSLRKRIEELQAERKPQSPDVVTKENGVSSRLSNEPASSEKGIREPRRLMPTEVLTGEEGALGNEQQSRVAKYDTTPSSASAAAAASPPPPQGGLGSEFMRDGVAQNVSPSIDDMVSIPIKGRHQTSAPSDGDQEMGSTTKGITTGIEASGGSHTDANKMDDDHLKRIEMARSIKAQERVVEELKADVDFERSIAQEQLHEIRGVFAQHLAEVADEIRQATAVSEMRSSTSSGFGKDTGKNRMTMMRRLQPPPSPLSTLTQPEQQQQHDVINADPSTTDDAAFMETPSHSVDSILSATQRSFDQSLAHINSHRPSSITLPSSEGHSRNSIDRSRVGTSRSTPSVHDRAKQGLLGVQLNSMTRRWDRATTQLDEVKFERDWLASKALDTLSKLKDAKCELASMRRQVLEYRRKTKSLQNDLRIAKRYYTNDPGTAAALASMMDSVESFGEDPDEDHAIRHSRSAEVGGRHRGFSDTGSTDEEASDLDFSEADSLNIPYTVRLQQARGVGLKRWQVLHADSHLRHRRDQLFTKSALQFARKARQLHSRFQQDGAGQVG